MKINHKILSLPPYISTSWKNVSSLSANEGDLIIVLQNGSKIVIPNLDAAVITEIFAAHEKYMDGDTPMQPQKKGLKPMSFTIPLDLTAGGALGVDSQFGPFMQHSSELAHSPDLPQEMLKKVSDVARSIGLSGESSHLPKPEPHCNCPYCQIARALSACEAPEKESEEVVLDEDLTFREWDIEETGDKLYKVSNPINELEVFHVYLGKPLGCTCGTQNCEHIRAVLNS